MINHTSLKATKLRAIIAANAATADGAYEFAGKARARQCAAHAKVMRASKALYRIKCKASASKGGTKHDLFADIFA